MFSLASDNHKIICLVDNKEANPGSPAESIDELPGRSKPVHVASAIAYDNTVIS